MEEIGYLIIQIFVLLLMAEVFGKILSRLGMPDIIGYILAGFVFVNLCAYTDLGIKLEFDTDVVFGDQTHFLNVMGQLGLVFLLFGIGLETRLSELLDIGKSALVITVTGIIFPFIGGVAVYFLFGSDVSGAIMLGTTIFAMSTVVSVKLLQMLGLTDSGLGHTVIGIAIFSDILCLVLLAVNTAIVNPVSDGSVVADLVIIIVFVALVFLFIVHSERRRKHISDVFNRLDIKVDISHRDLFTIGIVLCLAFTATSYVVGLSGIVGAFLAGMYFAEFEESTHVREKFDTLTKFLLPFFFITVGLRLRLGDMSSNAVLIAVVLAVVAIATKYAGGYVGARMCGVSRPVSGFYASCMVARGDIAIVVATLALSMGIFSTDLYAAVIIMAVITQVAATPLMKKNFRKIDKSDHMLSSMPRDEQ